MYSHTITETTKILLRIHQYRVRIIYKPGVVLFLVYWLSRQNHKENKDAEIPGIQVNIDTMQTTTNIPGCKTIQELQQAMSHNEHLQELREHITKDCSENKDQIL